MAVDRTPFGGDPAGRDDDETPPVPGAHRAPPVDTRPRSMLAVVALLLSLGLGLMAGMLVYLWVLVVPAVIVAAWAMVKIDPRVSKGHGMALGALLLGLLLGSCSFVGSWALRDTAEHVGHGVLKALQADNVDRVARWFGETVTEEDGAIERLIERHRAVTALHGRYEDGVDVGAVLLGGGPVLRPPPDLVEIPETDGEAEPMPPSQGTLWVQATFAKRRLYLALVLLGGDLDGLRAAVEAAIKNETAHVLEDVRYFVHP